MPKTRDTNLPQHDADQGHYGSIPLSLLPSGATSGDITYFSGSNWILTALSGLSAGPSSSGGGSTAFAFFISGGA